MHKKHILGLSVSLLLVACGPDEAAAPPAQPAAASSPPAAVQAPRVQDADCAPGEGIAYICGLMNAEDLLLLGSSDWVLTSGMNSEGPGPQINGKIYLVNRQYRSSEVLFPGDSPRMVHDTTLYPDCPGPIDIGNMSVHGLALQEYPAGSGRYRLYTTSHGAREAIETYEVDTTGAQPGITWTGCIPLPSNSFTNSVTILPDGGFMATQFMDNAGSGFAGVAAGEITGHVFEWHPGGPVEVMAGTELSGPNGIAISEDGEYLYVAAFGTHEIVRFELGTDPLQKTLVPVDITSDNLRWTPQGTIITAGGNRDGQGWSVWELDPATMAASRIGGAGPDARLQGGSSALVVGDELWVGTFMGDRIAILPRR